MHAPDRAPGVRLVTDHPGTTTPVERPRPSDEKIDAAKAFGHRLASLWTVAYGGTGIPGTSLLDGTVTFIAHADDGDYVVKAVRVEEYAQEF